MWNASSGIDRRALLFITVVIVRDKQSWTSKQKNTPKTKEKKSHFVNSGNKQHVQKGDTSRAPDGRTTTVFFPTRAVGSFISDEAMSAAMSASEEQQ